MSALLILRDTPSVTSSPALASGPMPCVAPAGLMIAPSGLPVVPANLSARQAKALGLLTSGISGPVCTGSSSSACLQSSLENRLRQKLWNLGSTLYKLTWKRWVMPSGVSRFRLRASGSLISASAPIGARSSVILSSLPTPTARDYRGRMSMETLLRRQQHSRGVNLHEFMQRKLGRPGYLNPELPRLLMRLPVEWSKLAPTETRSTLSKRRYLLNK